MIENCGRIEILNNSEIYFVNATLDGKVGAGRAAGVVGVIGLAECFTRSRDCRH